MDDAYFRDKISAYLDNGLPPEEMEMIARYLDENPEARVLAERLRGAQGLVDQHSQLSADAHDYWEELAARIDAKIAGSLPAESGSESERDEAAVSSKGPRPLVWAAWAASVAIIGFIGFHATDIWQSMVERNELPATIQPPSDAPGMQLPEATPEPEQTTTTDDAQERDRLDDADQAGEPQALPAETEPEGEGDVDLAPSAERLNAVQEVQSQAVQLRADSIDPATVATTDPVEGARSAFRELGDRYYAWRTQQSGVAPRLAGRTDLAAPVTGFRAGAESAGASRSRQTSRTTTDRVAAAEIQPLTVAERMQLIDACRALAQSDVSRSMADSLFAFSMLMTRDSDPSVAAAARDLLDLLDE